MDKVCDLVKICWTKLCRPCLFLKSSPGVNKKMNPPSGLLLQQQLSRFRRCQNLHLSLATPTRLTIPLPRLAALVATGLITLGMFTNRWGFQHGGPMTSFMLLADQGNRAFLIIGLINCPPGFLLRRKHLKRGYQNKFGSPRLAVPRQENSPQAKNSFLTFFLFFFLLLLLF